MSETSEPIPAVLPAEDRRASSPLPVVITTLLVIATLRLGQAVVLPVVIALLLTLTLTAPVRWLMKRRIAERFAAAIVVFGALATFTGAAALVATPAMQWIDTAPQSAQKLESRLQAIVRPFSKLQRYADRMQRATANTTSDSPRTVQIAAPGLVERLSFDTLSAIPIALTVVFLTYFLLANASLFRRKLAGLLPGRTELRRREHLLSQIEVAASHYLTTVVAVNAGVGLLTALALWAVGVPSPFLWGGVAAVLNFVPYLGPIVTASIIALAALVGVDDLSRAVIAPAIFLLIHLIETNLVTPTLLGRHLPVNTVALFLGLLFFGWMWGIPGAVLAVPLTVCAKLVCDHVPSLAHVGELLDN